MDQRTKAWYDWRKKGLGASDAPIVMGVSPWSTAHELWEQKTGRVVKDHSNWATNRGNELEPRARAHLELELGMDFPAILSEHPKFPFMRASLDGWNSKNKIVLEIKCPGAADHQSAKEGKVPEKYFPQIQHQIFVTGATKAIYYSYTEDKETGKPEGFIVEVLADIEYIKKLFEAMCKFWICIEKDIEPELTEKDFKNVRSADLAKKLDEWSEAVALVKHHEAIVERLKHEIFEDEKIKGRRCNVGKYRINVVTRKGNVDYKKVPELKGVDLEKYRAKSSVYQQITIRKEDEG